ncbi:hypothetical protein BDV24DRAFT_122994 [Aspergillus arachidicola]|uniref:Uncharacterized protein n=1 Tax=Aspergillus arachidicola TaxID=656916 RepID=A0A5N6YNW1_9EURO|nr:hypothetical protein BDV24DRAFT_122994 [Aspergillus arachidicola]
MRYMALLLLYVGFWTRVMDRVIARSFGMLLAGLWMQVLLRTLLMMMRCRPRPLKNCSA